jgi:hypothetical protein
VELKCWKQLPEYGDLDGYDLMLHHRYAADG